MDRELLIRLLEQRSGHRITNVSDCEWLARDFKRNLNDTIGVNTLKRLLGFLKYDKTHRVSTYDIVARYLGYRDMKELEVAVKEKTMCFGHNPDVLLAEMLEKGTAVEVMYRPDRSVDFEYLGNSTFKVNETHNTELEKGDTAVIHQFVLNFPLIAVNVTRRRISLGEFTDARTGGLISIKVKNREY